MNFLVKNQFSRTISGTFGWMTFVVNAILTDSERSDPGCRNIHNAADHGELGDFVRYICIQSFN